MHYLSAIVAVFFALKVKEKWLIAAENLTWAVTELQHKDMAAIQHYQMLLMDIQRERAFDAVLIFGQSESHYPLMDIVAHTAVPTVIMTKDNGFHYQSKFNSATLSIIILEHEKALDIMKTAAYSLEFMRQSRILIIAMANMTNLESVKSDLLHHCRTYKMTNVLLSFANNQQSIFTLPSLLFALKPYPEYYWAPLSPAMNRHNDVYYPQHWLDMRNFSIVTITDKAMPNSFVFKDAQGQYRINGFVANLIVLFAQRFNASLKMYRPLNELPDLHFVDINEMVKDNLVDLPMATSPPYDVGWQDSSYVYEISQAIVLVPCARSLTTREVFRVLLNVYFFGAVFVCVWLISLLHTLIDYLYTGVFDVSRVMLGDKILPGVLGQSFVARKLPSRGLKLLYLVVFLAGLNTSTRFAANIKTLFTSPPYHKQLRTFDDIRNSNLKILIATNELPLFEEAAKPFDTSLQITSNVTFYLEAYRNFNTSFGFLVFCRMWQILIQSQQFFTHKIFCTTEGLVILDHVPMTFRLPHNSPLKEPLDELIHQVQAVGLSKYWYLSTFYDMLKMQKVSIRDPNPCKGAKVLSVNDLFLVWMIAVGGLLLSIVVFLLELVIGYGVKFYEKYNKMSVN